MASNTVMPIPGLNMLGYGYDVFASPYCDQRYSKGDANGLSLLNDFDMSNPANMQPREVLGKIYNVPTGVIVQTDQETNQDYTIYADSSEEYSRQLTVSVNVSADIAGFSGSVSTNYSSSSSSYLEQIYGEHGHVFNGINVILPVSPSNLRLRLKASVVRDLTTMSPDDLIKMYGTHIVTGVMIGGKAFLRQSSRRSDVTNTSDWRAAVEASYDGISSSTTVDTKTKDIQKTFNSSLDVQTLGGLAIIIDSSDSSGKFQKWYDSIKDHPAVIDVTEVVPLWQLMKPADPRRLQLQKAIVAYARRYQPGALMGAQQQYNTLTEDGAWRQDTAQLQAVGRSAAISNGMTFRDGDNRASREVIYFNTGQESQSIQRMAIYGGEQLQSNETSSDPFTVRTTWGVTTTRSGKSLEKVTVFVGFLIDGFDYLNILSVQATKRYSFVNLFVGPIEEAEGDCWVVRGGYAINANGSTTWQWGATPNTNRGTPLKDVMIFECVAWAQGGGDWQKSTVHVYLQPVLTNLTEKLPDNA